MNNLMQREDFLTLCKPKRRPGGKCANAIRIFDDWFPAGCEFLFNGLPYKSLGPSLLDLRGEFQARLGACSIFRGPNIQEVVYLSVSSALSLARQNSVDAINALNFFDQHQ